MLILMGLVGLLNDSAEVTEPTSCRVDVLSTTTLKVGSRGKPFLHKDLVADIRNRAISAEFDMIYAVFHPGRARSHGFGLFGGSNGYWRSR